MCSNKAVWKCARIFRDSIMKELEQRRQTFAFNKSVLDRIETESIGETILLEMVFYLGKHCHFNVLSSERKNERQGLVCIQM